MTRSAFKAHIDLAHQYWQQIVEPGDIIVDATCGNGQDTLFLASLQPSLLYALDIQAEALANTKTLLGEQTSVIYHQGCHSQFPKEIQPHSVKLIVYNLGYLPGGNKALTTLSETTLLSVKQALELIKPEGAISVTCYPGHPAGAVEENAMLAWAQELNPRLWSCCHHRWCNRPKAPSLLWIQKTYN